MPREKSTILNCTYCLSEDQRWLLATATDDLGEILETVTINIEIPNRYMVWPGLPQSAPHPHTDSKRTVVWGFVTTER